MYTYVTVATTYKKEYYNRKCILLPEIKIYTLPNHQKYHADAHEW